MVHDEDGDGTAERAGAVSLHYAYGGGGPAFARPPRASDGELVIDTAGEVTFEVWRTTANGRRLSDDPRRDRVAWYECELPAGPEVFEITAPLRAGEWLTVFDTTWNAQSPPTQVRAD